MVTPQIIVLWKHLAQTRGTFILKEAYNFLCGVFGSDRVMPKQELADHDAPDAKDGRHEAGDLRG